ncbi:MAG: sugar O-acyltransferase, partial [Chloroflexi bacterium]|nr:sugar O-acyltransferase [Chloroflexota bacterium]MBI4675635.1 sugar O-acyltransferase [Chloroflexota bacterium]
MTKKIIILGTGGNSVDILDTLRDVNDAQREAVYECIGFLDDDAQKWG